MLKKLLTLSLVFVGVLALAACKPTPDGPTDLEKIAEALAEIELPSEASSDLTFPSTGLHDVTITWESDNTDVIANDGTVTIPTKTMGDKTVKITAFVTIGENTLTKTFNVSVIAQTEYTNAELLDQAKTALLLVDQNVITDITLVETSLGATVTWSSSNTDYIANDGTVTRPAEGEANVDVTLTATLTLNGESVTKEFVITVVADEIATVYTTVQAMYDNAILNDYIEFTGTVVAIFDGGYFLTDGTHSIGVYHRGIDIAMGDEVHLKGFYKNYNTLYQLSGLVLEEVKSQGNANPLTPMVKTIEEINALDASVKNIHGMPYTVTGTLEFRQSGSYTNLFLVDGDHAFQIYHYSLEDSLEVLEDLVGREVTLNLTYYTEYQKTGIVYMAFDGALADIDVTPLAGQEALDAAQAGLDSQVINVTNGDNVVLPTDGGNNVVFSGWTSSDTAVLGNDGTFVALATGNVVITFTATATAPATDTTVEMTQEVTVDVVVPINSSVADVLAGNTEDFFQVTGIVYELSYYGMFIEDNGSYIFVFGKSLKDDYVKGDQVIILGSRSMYSGLYQVSIEDIEKGTTGNTLPTAVSTTVSAVMNDVIPRGTIATVTGMVTQETVTDGDKEYTDIYITDVAGGKVKVYYRSNADELLTHKDTVVTLDIIGYNNGVVLYQGVAADAVAATYTDQYKLQAAVDFLDLGDDKVFDDITLPADDGGTVIDFTWVSDTPASITDAGVVTQTTSDVAVTLTVTATDGTLTATRDIVIVVAEAPLTVTEALALDFTNDTVTLVTGIVTGVHENYGDIELVIQDPATGAAIYVDGDLVDAKVGDEVILRGTLDIYDNHSNNKKQIESLTYDMIVSSDNAVTVDAETDVAVIADAFADMKTYTATLTVKSFDNYGYVFFDGSATRDLKFSYDTFAPYFKDVYAVDDTVVVTFTVMDINFSDTRVVNVQLPALTEAQKVMAGKALLQTSYEAFVDLELPATDEYGNTITWSTSDAAVVTDAGVVTRPAAGSGDATATLTATITNGSESDTLAVTVTVKEAQVPDLFISEYIEGGSNNKAIEIYNPTGAAVDLSIYSIKQNKGGGTIYDYALTGTLNAGEVLVICTDQVTADTNLKTNCDIELSYPSVMHFNGNDTVQLLKNDVVIDQFGNEADAGGDNFAIDVTLVRKSYMVAGSTVYDATQWVEYDKDTFDHVGSHTTD